MVSQKVKDLIEKEWLDATSGKGYMGAYNFWTWLQDKSIKVSLKTVYQVLNNIR